MDQKPIFVTKPFLPPLEEFIPYLEQLWQSRVLTNGGAFHRELEEALARFLGVPFVALFNNGTNALLTAVQALDLTGEVITTPYSFVATAHSLLWNQLEPVFVDVNPNTLNIDPERIEVAITERTTAIMPVHCYGHPCDTAAIARIAGKHGLKIIYDAAHAFAVNDVGGSVLRHGDLSVLSFHATKVFNTFEGGAIICGDAEMKAKIDQLKNFGITGETEVFAAGSNGKMNELSAALGLLQLKYLRVAVDGRRAVDARYRERLNEVEGVRPLEPAKNTVANYSYFPVLVGADYALSRDALFERLKQHGIVARRYFYPLISEFAPYRHLRSSGRNHLPIATRAAEQVLCLPIYPDLPVSEIDRICDIIQAA